MNTLRRIVAVADRCIGALLVVLVSALLAITLLSIFFRFVLNDSLIWSLELSVFINVWIGFIGAVLVLRHWQHTNMPTFVDLLPAPLRYYLMIAVKTVPLAFLLFLLKYGVDYVQSPFHILSLSMGFSSRWVKVVIPASAALMVLYAVYVMIEDICALRRRRDEYFKNQGSSVLE